MIVDNDKARVLDTTSVAKKLINYNLVDIDAIPENCRRGDTRDEIINNFVEEYGLSALTFKERGDD